ncbi:hypothetical protein B0T24DRAFT_613079 [Lasiosphaeria ovina]|uniref:Uncharacterized protein n=1 Tax=Lasiosphaeria ovina TaxID=92902 RepID=A0AAE0NE55_9PEZI|nr:hypothetical protein B0T24DRAFT_613079 [Lasiosphaeria ovina]
MSGNRSQQPSLDPSQYQNANGLVRSILDDRLSTATVSPSGELYRAIERFHWRANRDHHIPAAQATPETSMSSGSERDLRRRFNLDPQQGDGAVPGTSTPAGNPPSLPPLRSLGTSGRPGMASSGGSGGSGGHFGRFRASDRFLERHRSRLHSRSTNPSFEDMDRNLENANSHLRALLDFTNNPIITPPLAHPSDSSPSHGHDQAEESHRVKRRKLDSNKITSTFKGFHYGRYGQLEPGKLTMEIVSCDGGLYEGKLLDDQESCVPENILKDDNSVYCTKGNRCNIVLRHQGATVFSLKELIIKAPGERFSSPIRQGMVFVSMNSDDVLQRTTNYRILYEEPRRRNIPPSQRPGALVALRHPDDPDGSRPLLTRYPNQRLHNHGMGDGDEYLTAVIPTEFNAMPAPFNVTTECSGDESERSGRRFFRRPPEIGTLPFESQRGDNGPDIWTAASSFTLAGLRWHRMRERDRAEAESMTLEEAQDAAQIATQDAVRAVGANMLAPLAHFNIRLDENRCTINFDPPVSGRFILLKMWSTHEDPRQNIDIQTVIANGFAGPRSFPSVELR